VSVAAALGDRFDRPALARAVAAFEHNADLEGLVLDPLLELDELDVQLRQFLVVDLARRPAGIASRTTRTSSSRSASDAHPDHSPFREEPEAPHTCGACGAVRPSPKRGERHPVREPAKGDHRPADPARRGGRARGRHPGETGCPPGQSSRLVCGFYVGTPARTTSTAAKNFQVRRRLFLHVSALFGCCRGPELRSQSRDRGFDSPRLHSSESVVPFPSSQALALSRASLITVW
jgi:hypothetical protein